jgi:site-specific DNA-cytosine methylase
MPEKLKVLSLFSGIGGLELALEQTGRFETVCQVEYDAFCLKILSRHWPTATRANDINETSFSHIDSGVKMEYTPAEDEEGTDMGRLRKLTEEQVEESVRLYQGGLSLGDIGLYFGVSRQAMWSLLKRRIELRPQQQTG